MTNKIKTYFRLGLANIFRVAKYRAYLILGIYKAKQKIKKYKEEIYFQVPIKILDKLDHGGEGWIYKGDRILGGEIQYFSGEWKSIETSKRRTPFEMHWSDVNEFSLGVDIKIIWEYARMDFLVPLVICFLKTSNKVYLDAINKNLNRFLIENPLYAGENWKCGQEVAIRVNNILLVAQLLKKNGYNILTNALEILILDHIKRIMPTLSYAIGQDNNHATSEASALFNAGCFYGQRDWIDKGRNILESRVKKLILKDGSFSQNSVNYHRLLLDTLSICEWFRVSYNQNSFSDGYYKKVRSAIYWLYSFTDDQSGDAPNLGANDGAMVYVFHELGYRNFKPSVQLASSFFLERLAYPKGQWDEPLTWLTINKLLLEQKQEVQKEDFAPFYYFENGGYVKICNEKKWALLRLPQYLFRPSHADAHHFDFWIDGINLIRDSGSFSYNKSLKELNIDNEMYFSSTESHSTVQVDDRDQMDKISRFLFTNWLTLSKIKIEAHSVHSSFVDSSNVKHERIVRLLDRDTWIIEDNVFNFKEKAILRWRLAPLQWNFFGSTVECSYCNIEVSSNQLIVRSELNDGFESRYYNEANRIPIFEVEVSRAPVSFKTIISIKK
jgi:hypothetical protein